MPISRCLQMLNRQIVVEVIHPSQLFNSFQLPLHYRVYVFPLKESVPSLSRLFLSTDHLADLYTKQRRKFRFIILIIKYYLGYIHTSTCTTPLLLHSFLQRNIHILFGEELCVYQLAIKKRLLKGKHDFSLVFISYLRNKKNGKLH